MEQILFKVDESHKAFIRELFEDEAVAKYVIIDEEVKDDVGKLVDVWLEEDENAAGATFIVCAVEPATITKPEKQIPCGFISFERRTQDSGRVTYALKATYRGQGYIKTGLKTMLKLLKDWGMKVVEADIDTDNIASENIVKLLGFTTNRSKAVFDFERGGKMRHIWTKEL